MEKICEDLPDSTLIAKVLLSDDRRAFGQLVKRHQGMVRAQLRRLTAGDHAWADDLAQETFIQVWRKLNQFRGDASFPTWLYRVAYTIYLQSMRQKPKQIECGELVEDAALNDGALRVDLARAMERLPDNERLVLLHCCHIGLSHEEAAWILGMPVGTVKTNLVRGKARLREWLTHWS
jgi:RNA polymerase sigma-70 factor (ECF subfamily)